MLMNSTVHLSNEEARQMLIDFAGLFWRLEKNGYITAEHTGDDAEERVCNHWRDIGNGLVNRLRGDQKR